MAAAQRPGGQQAKICQFKLVLLGKRDFFHQLKSSVFSWKFRSAPTQSNKETGILFPPTLTQYCPASQSSFTSGESAVGKSSLVLRFVKGQFHEFQEVSRKRTGHQWEESNPLISSQPSELHFWPRQSVWTTRQWSLRSGTPPARSDITPWHPCTTGGPRPPSWSTISPTPTPSREPSLGWRNCRDR